MGLFDTYRSGAHQVIHRHSTRTGGVKNWLREPGVDGACPPTQVELWEEFTIHRFQGRQDLADFFAGGHVTAAVKRGAGTPAMRVRRWPGSTRPAPGMTSATKNGPKSGNRDESRHGGCGLRVSRAAPQEKDARRERARPASPWTQSHESAHEETSAD